MSRISPINYKERLNLSSIGISGEAVRFWRCTMESDHFISVCETKDHQTHVIYIDLLHGNQVTKHPISAEVAIMHPESKVIALSAGFQVQIFDLNQKAKVKACQMSEALVFWRWISPSAIGIVTATCVYHWTLEGDSGPAELFGRHASLGGASQIINYKVSSDGEWCLLMAVSCKDGEVQGTMQLYSVKKGVSQVIVGHAGAFARVKMKGRADYLQVLCFFQKKSGSSKFRLVFVECTLEKDRSESFNLLPKPHDIEMFPEAENDFPTALQVDSMHDVLFMITKKGYLFLFDIHSGKTIFRTKFTDGTIFVTAPHTSTGGLLGITSQQGQVLQVEVNELTIVQYVSSVLQDDVLAADLATRIKPAGHKDWTCLFCSSLNAADCMVCVMCNTPKPLHGAQWMCTHCTYVNLVNSACCQMCEKENDPDLWKKRLQLCDAVDAMGSNGEWYEAVIVELAGTIAKIHFKGWSTDYDTLVDIFSDSIKPLHSQTPNWHNLKVGDAIDIRKEVEPAQWTQGEVAHVSSKAVLVKSKVSAVTRWVPIESEDICRVGQHLLSDEKTPCRQQVVPVPPLQSNFPPAAATGAQLATSHNVEQTPNLCFFQYSDEEMKRVTAESNIPLKEILSRSASSGIIEKSCEIKQEECDAAEKYLQCNLVGNPFDSLWEPKRNNQESVRDEQKSQLSTSPHEAAPIQRMHQIPHGHNVSGHEAGQPQGIVHQMDQMNINTQQGLPPQTQGVHQQAPQFMEGETVMHRDSNGQIGPARIVKIHYETTPPYFSVLMLKTGTERNTDAGHLMQLQSPEIEDLVDVAQGLQLHMHGRETCTNDPEALQFALQQAPVSELENPQKLLMEDHDPFSILSAPATPTLEVNQSSPPKCSPKQGHLIQLKQSTEFQAELLRKDKAIEKLTNDLSILQMQTQQLKKKKAELEALLFEAQSKIPDPNPAVALTQLMNQVIVASGTDENKLNILESIGRDFVKHIEKTKEGLRSQEDLCCVCLDQRKTVVLFPCKHLCICTLCSNKPLLKKCPICCTEILEKVVIFS